MSVVAVAMGGCVMPPPVDEADPATNRQPTIDVQTDGRPLSLACNGDTAFGANISDPDTNDTLFWRVFIDYFRANADDLRAAEQDFTEVPPRRNGAVRIVTFKVAATDATIQERPSDVHVVELFVADRAFDTSFDDDPANDNSGQIGRVAISPGLTASYVWTINPVDCP